MKDYGVLIAARATYGDQESIWTPHLSTRFANSATTTNAGAGMDLINTIFQVKSNKLAIMER
jgi:hypothetical protein